MNNISLLEHCNISPLAKSKITITTETIFKTAETTPNNIMKNLNDKQVSEVKEDCEHFDDTDEKVKYIEIDSTKISLFKKFRTQNIRQIKSQKLINTFKIKEWASTMLSNKFFIEMY